MFREDLHGDVGKRGPPARPALRRCVIEDIPWLGELVQESYAGLVDIERCEQYFRATLGRADHIYLRGEQSAVGARWFIPYWAPLNSRPLASDLFFCAEPRKSALVELAFVMEKVVQWSQSCGCRQMAFTALNGANIERLAKRAGVTELMPSFRAVFRGH